MKRRRNKIIQLCFFSTLLIVIFVVSLLAKRIAPHDPYLVDMSLAFTKPCPEYPLGTDNLGRCILSRLLYGAVPSILSGVVVVVIVFFIGTFLGISAAYIGGIYESVVVKIITVFQAFPGFVLAMAIAGMLGTGIRNGMISLCVVYWTSFARVARSLTLEMREKEYIRSARISGAGTFRIIRKHILPNILAPLIVMAALDIGGVILSLAGLSFLGLSAQRPMAEWGMMLNDNRQYLQTATWTVVFPGSAIFLVVIAFNLMADTLRDVLDPKSLNIIKNSKGASKKWKTNA